MKKIHRHVGSERSIANEYRKYCHEEKVDWICRKSDIPRHFCVSDKYFHNFSDMDRELSLNDFHGMMGWMESFLDAGEIAPFRHAVTDMLFGIPQQPPLTREAKEAIKEARWAKKHPREAKEAKKGSLPTENLPPEA